MATTKVGTYRSYYGPVPKDSSGQPLPKNQWPTKRDHSWVVRWFGDDGNRYSKSFKSRKEAERLAESKQQDVRVGRADPPQDIRLADFLKEHEKVMRGQVASETLADQMRAVKMFAQQVGEQRMLRRITPRDAEAFVSKRLAEVRAATVSKDIRTLKRVFNLAIEPRGYVLPGQNPFAKIKQRKMAPRTPRFVKPAEFGKMVVAAGTTWWKALLSVAYTTAARLGEIVNLTWADVDFEEGRIRIVRKEARDRLPGWEPKDHEGRLLPVPPEVMQRLADLQAECPEGNPYVFVPGWRWKFIQEAITAGTWDEEKGLLNNLNQRLNRLLKKTGVRRFTYHDLRRTCITNWARRLPIHVVQRLAGHSDIRTTQKYYLSVQEDDLERARDVQAAILASTRTDQLLTNSVQNEPLAPQNAEGPKA